MTSQHRTLVFATDFSPTARAAMPHVILLARAFDATAVLCHVQRSPFRSWSQSGSLERQARDRLEA